MTTAERLEKIIALPASTCHPFLVGCSLAGVAPTERQLRAWQRGDGAPLRAMWQKHPKSKNLPRLSS